MVTYIRSDLDFILNQIKIAEDHALYIESGGTQGRPLYGADNPNTPQDDSGSIPSYNIAWGLRTVDGSYNHLLPGQEYWGASDREFAEMTPPEFRTVTIMMDPDGPGPSGIVPVSMPYTPGNDVDGPGTFASPGDVIDPQLRTISNLLADQTLGNPAAILTALQNAGIDDPGFVITNSISAAYAPLATLFQDVAVAERAYASAAALAAANPNNAAAQAEAAEALASLEAAQADLDAAAGVPGGLYDLLAANGIELDGANVHIPNFAPDEGLSAPFNSWFTLFGQFFDHGLDLVNKGGSGTVLIPLQEDDPLYVPGSQTNFMVLTRATRSPGADGVLGDDPTTAADESLDDGAPVNTTTSYVDQNQTYTSHPSHQIFLRQYVADANGVPHATGKLIEGSNGGMANWGEVKAQAADLLGIQLTDLDVGAVPLVRTDPYGNFIPGANGFPQVIFGLGADGIPNTADDVVVEGNPAANGGLGISLVGAIRTNHAFLADIAHTAVPDGLADGDTEIGGNIPEDGFYDNELLDAHFIAGDGRANENIGLTAVHHVFHAEHNRLVEHTKEEVLATGDINFINEWLAVDITTIPADPSTLIWDGERLFQAAKFGTEMQYQHLVFEEFARKVSPSINTFLVPDGFDTTLDPSIVAEFAHVVYRFGHSMLTESIDRFDENFQGDHISLIQGFLNPTAFNGPGGDIADEIAAGDIVRGMTRQVGNEIDEFVTSALRNNLLGLPLDLATINLARGRDTGVPSLNSVRAQFYEASNQNVLLKPYESWVDFAGHLKHEASIINFIAAYGTHDLITSQTTVQGKRDAALTLIFGTPVGDIVIGDPATFEADRQAFLNGTGEYAGSLGGLNDVDLWIGGLAEEIMPFGGMLGSTFAYVFEIQLERLQSGDRFYYLQRLDGLHLFGEMENNSFASMIMRHTNATHLPSDVFSTPGLILEVDRTRQFNDLDGDGDLESDDPLGGGILTQLVVRNNPGTPGTDTNYLRYTGGDHVVLGGTDNADIIIAGIGDDTLYGDGGNDNLQGGFGNDIINGGDGDDIIADSGGDDNIKAGDGNDVVHAGPGLDLVLGGRGKDFIFLGTDEGSEVFAGEGDDFIYGNKNAERILGNEGNDWIETGTFDGAPGDNFDEIFAHDGIDGHDVFLGDGGFDEFIGEGGDDIMVGSPGRGKMAGMSGWDWATYKDNTFGVNADLSLPIIFDEAGTPPPNAALDGYESMEGLSGSRFNDVLRGSDTLAEERLPASQGGTEGFAGSQLDLAGVQLIGGLADVVGGLVTATQSYSAGDIILGGDGSDLIEGGSGDDIIDGDKWLDVYIRVNGTVPAGVPTRHSSMTTLAALMFAGTINPGQLEIVREIVSTADATPDIDIAQYSGARTEYSFAGNADGTIQVTHAIEDAVDGSDRLRNIERLRFGDNSEVGIVVGTNAGETLNGTAGDDLILGLGGNDTLNGLGGNDILVGGAGNDTLNGGAGDDTYSFSAGDGSDTIQETSGIDRISIAAGPLTTLNVFEVTTGIGNDNLVIQYNGQQITVVDHFDTTGEAVEFINFNGATFNGYVLDGDYAISTDDTGARTAAPLVNTLLVGTTGEDTLQGNTGNDLLFGHDDDDELQGGDGDDLLVGGAGNDTLDGGLDADVMAGGSGNDTYIVDDLADVVVEAAGAGTGTDEVETEMAELSIELFANVENLTYTGADADPFVGTGNAGNNVITGGDLNDTLRGLAGNDTLNGGLGADTLEGGEGNDTYVVDDAGDVVNESTGLATDVDTVTSAIDFTLAAGLENLTLTGGAILGRGNAANNVITGNGAANQLFGAGGADTINGNDGNDVIDAGDGDDTVNGGDDADTVTGGAGNDTITVNSGNDVLRYTASGFGADVVIGFDSVGGTAATQDMIDVSALGVTAANFAARVTITDVEDGTVDDTLITVRDAGGATIGTIRLDEVEATGANGVTAADFILAAAAPTTTITGNNTGQTHNGGNGAETINALGGNDTVNANGGNDVVNGGEGADTLNGGDGNDTLSGGVGSDTGTFLDQFGTASYSNSNGTVPWTGSWTEGGGETTSPTGGDIGISGGRLQFNSGVDGGETIERALNLAGATSATVSFAYEDDNLGAGQSVIVQARNVVTNAWETLTNGTLGSTTPNGNGTFTASLTANQIGANSAIRFVTTGDGNNWDTGDNFYVDNLTVTINRPGLNAGVDTVNGNAGDDTIVWNANASGVTDGRDMVNGGTEGTAGDVFVVNGNAGAETYRIYTREAWLGVAGNTAGSLGGATEIVVTRNGTNASSIIAELVDIEEIRINGFDPSGSGTAAGDTFELIGDFSGTSLRPNTVTIAGSDANDVIDISALTSPHRVVYTANGGNDTLIGTPRPQDVLDGQVTVTDPGPSVDSNAINGTNGADTLTGKRTADTLNGLDGNDRLFGGRGDDKLNGGTGNDVMDGEAGNDVFVFEAGFGQDKIRNFDANAKGGQDLLDVSKLGVTAANFAVSVVIEDLGNDTLVSIGDNSILLKDVNGAGNNTITIADFLLA